MREHKISPDVSLGEGRGKDKNFQPIERNTSLKKLSDLYAKSFEEFCHQFPPHTPTQYLFDLHDLLFTSKHLKNERGRLRWKV